MKNPERGEVWLTQFDPSVGSEIRKLRPGVILSRSKVGNLPLRFVVPLTDWKPHYEALEWFMEVLPTTSNGLNKPSAADAFQCKSLAVERFVRKLGHLTEEQLEDIAARVNFCIT